MVLYRLPESWGYAEIILKEILKVLLFIDMETTLDNVIVPSAHLGNGQLVRRWCTIENLFDL